MMETHNLTFAEFIKVNNSPKKYVIVAPSKIYLTNNPEHILKKFVAKEFPKCKPTDIKVILTANFK